MSTAARDRRPTHRLDPGDLAPDDGERGRAACTWRDGATPTAPSDHLGTSR